LKKKKQIENYKMIKGIRCNKGVGGYNVQYLGSQKSPIFRRCSIFFVTTWFWYLRTFGLNKYFAKNVNFWITDAEWDSNPHSTIFGCMLLPLTYWRLLRSLAESKLKLFSALNSVWSSNNFPIQILISRRVWTNLDHSLATRLV